MIATAVHDYGRILRVTTTQRTPRLLRALGWLTAALWAAMLVGRLGGLFPEVELAPGALLRQGVFAAALALIVVWSMVFMPGSMLVHAAASARMLPRQRRRLFQLAFGSWALLCTALALAMQLWGLFLLAGTVSLAIGLMYSGRRAGALLLIVGPGAVVPLSFLPRSVTAALGSPAGLLALSVLLLAIGWLALRTHYPVEGSERMRRHTVAEPLGNAADNRWNDTAWAGAVAMQRRALRSRDPETLLAQGMGPGFHWATAALLPAITLALVLAAWALMALWGAAPPKSFVDGAVGGMIGTAMWSIGLHSVALRKQLASRRGEQALLRLAPLVGDKAALNRRLAGAILKSAVLGWVLMTAIYLSMLAACGARPEQLEVLLAMCCIGGQFGLSELLDDYAHRPVLQIGDRIGTIGIIAAEIFVTVAWGALAGFPGWRWLAALSIAASIVQVWHDRRRLLHASPALPAGRMEKAS